MNEINAKLSSIGIALLGNREYCADPEQTIIQALKEVGEDRKLLSLVIGWIEEFSDLVHVERLRVLAKNCAALELAWLGGIASYAAEKDRRFEAITSFVKKTLGENWKGITASKLDKLAAKRKGKDEHFAKFGIIIPHLEPASEKKLHTRMHVLSQHPWFRLRVLFGPCWRADIAWEILRDQNQTPYKVAKTLGCNTETAYRNWRALEEAEAYKLLNIRIAG